MCLLEDNYHEGHPRKNLKDLTPGVLVRLSSINDGLISKRQQVEETAKEIEDEISDISEHV